MLRACLGGHKPDGCLVLPAAAVPDEWGGLMDLGEFFRTLRRQWILTLLLLLLTLFAVYEANIKFSGPYQAESVIVLLPSQKAAEPNGRNPYLSFDSSINVAGDIVLRQVMDPHTVAALAAKGASSSYEILDDPNTAAPMLDVTATGGDKAQVESTLQVVTRTFQARLDTLQQSLKPVNRVTSMVIFKDPVAKLELSKKARVLVVFLVIGLVLTCAIPLMVDAEITRRRSRRGSGEAGAGHQGWCEGVAAGWAASPAGRPHRPGRPRRPRMIPRSGYSRTAAKARQAAEQPSPQQAPEPARPGGDPIADEAAWPYKNWPAAPTVQEKTSGTSTPAGNGGPAGNSGPAGNAVQPGAAVQPGTAIRPGTPKRSRPGPACPCGGEAGQAAASCGHAATGPDASGSPAPPGRHLWCGLAHGRLFDFYPRGELGPVRIARRPGHVGRAEQPGRLLASRAGDAEPAPAACLLCARWRGAVGSPGRLRLAGTHQHRA